MAGITDKEVRGLISRAKGEGRTITQADGTVPGLTIGASKTGAASWVLRYYVHGKRKEATIGQYPTWGIADAREKAKELRRAVDDGVDVCVSILRRDTAPIALLVTQQEISRIHFGTVEQIECTGRGENVAEREEADVCHLFGQGGLFHGISFRIGERGRTRPGQALSERWVMNG